DIVRRRGARRQGSVYAFLRTAVAGGLTVCYAAPDGRSCNSRSSSRRDGLRTPQSNSLFDQQEDQRLIARDCSFHATIRTERLDLPSVAALFEAAGWQVKSTVNLVGLESTRSRLTLETGSPMVLQGCTSEPERVLDLLARPGFVVASEWRDQQG